MSKVIAKIKNRIEQVEYEMSWLAETFSRTRNQLHDAAEDVRDLDEHGGNTQAYRWMLSYAEELKGFVDRYDAYAKELKSLRSLIADEPEEQLGIDDAI